MGLSRDGFLWFRVSNALTRHADIHNITDMETDAAQPDARDRDKVSLLSRTLPIALDEPHKTDSEMCLTIRTGTNAPPRNIAIDRKLYTIGRQTETDICIPDPSVSRQHARIFFLHDEEILEDLNSTNGSFVNGVRVTRCVLQDNDIIRIGDATMLFSRAAPDEREQQQVT